MSATYRTLLEALLHRLANRRNRCNAPPLKNKSDSICVTLDLRQDKVLSIHFVLFSRLKECVVISSERETVLGLFRQLINVVIHRLDDLK